jgi:hypothetical protein
VAVPSLPFLSEHYTLLQKTDLSFKFEAAGPTTTTAATTTTPKVTTTTTPKETTTTTVTTTTEDNLPKVQVEKLDPKGKSTLTKFRTARLCLKINVFFHNQLPSLCGE